MTHFDGGTDRMDLADTGAAPKTTISKMIPRHRIAAVLFVPVVLCLFLVNAGIADEPPSAVGSVMKLLKSGRVPPARIGSVVEMVCTRGNEHDLNYVFQQALSQTAYSADLRQKTLLWLREAAQNRKTMPTERSELAQLLGPGAHDTPLQLLAIELANAWRDAELAEPLIELASSSERSPQTRSAAITALVSIDAAAARKIATELLSDGHPYASRTLGATTLVLLEAVDGAEATARVLGAATPDDDVAPLIDAVLAREGGTAALGTALQKTPLSQDVAKRCLRRVYAAGRSDAALLDILAPQAGISNKPVQLTAEQVSALAKTAADKGDAARGEQVFRRADLSCMKCHAVNKAGGQIGPDLTPVGANSPMEYLVTALFDPDAQIKEAFITRTVTTLEGRVFQGITVDRTDQKLVLRNTDGRLIEIPVSEIDEEVEGKSLMPKGLPTLLTESETFDLLKFLSSLGKPGDYAVRSTQRFQRWRVLHQPSPELLQEIPNLVIFETDVLANGLWGTAYSLVNGTLPLDEVSQAQKSPIFYLQVEYDVVEPGPAILEFDSVDGLTVWHGKEIVASPAGARIDLVSGRGSITLRVDLAQRHDHGLQLELVKPAGSTGQFQVVDGQ